MKKWSAKEKEIKRELEGESERQKGRVGGKERERDKVKVILTKR